MGDFGAWMEPAISGGRLSNLSSGRPMTLRYGSLETELVVPTTLYPLAVQLKDQFITLLPHHTDDTAGNDEPLSASGLVARYLGYVADETEKHYDCDERSLYEGVLNLVLDGFERGFLQDNDVHALAAGLPGPLTGQLAVIRSYYRARHVSGISRVSMPKKPVGSALLRAAADESAVICTVFGGQGNVEDYFAELRQTYSTYQPLVDELVTRGSQLLQRLSANPEVDEFYPRGLDVMTWLRDEKATPDVDYLVSAPVSCPLIGLVQLAHYEVTCRVLGIHPGALRDLSRGTTGHSQGIVIAAITAAADGWESWRELTDSALTILFWIGARSQQSFPGISITPRMLRDSRDHGEGAPTPMLSIRDLSRIEVERHIAAMNQHLPADSHIATALINNPSNLVVAGPPACLCGLNTRLRKAKAPMGLEQNRVPSRRRQVCFTNRFLPVTVPFHSQYLSGAAKLIDRDLKDVTISPKALRIPVRDTITGEDMRQISGSSIVPALVRLVTLDSVDWVKATSFPHATHILEFGPGGSFGVGVLTARNKEGTGIRVVLAGSLGGSSGIVGYKHEVFDRGGHRAVAYSKSWEEEFGPRLATVKSTERTYVDTKLSRLLGVPPVLVAGMTPTTVAWDFVAATMMAGYYIELAGGGYRVPEAMSEALASIERSMPAGRGINVNLIYANPAAISWQIPLVRRLRAEGVPIEGLTIGAGVPSLEVAQGYIDTMGLKYISFKPGSINAIQAVIDIAKTRPTFPVVLQWTGGRGGGHHSFEDLHDPILATYGRIRQQKNIILVAGSGFGGGEDTYPFLTGGWSEQYGRPLMPFDGCLLGSRVMVAKEAHTSPAAKQAIVNTSGVDDTDWERSYDGPVGGVITVRSEMGEPIHKLATRGVVFWAEMDRTIFSLPKDKRVAELKRNRRHIIERLNHDFQKVWFGRDADDRPCDLEDMTYGQVVQRLVNLMYVREESRWIDPSYMTFTGDFVRRVEDRFTSQPSRPSLLLDYSDLMTPCPAVQDILACYPGAEKQLLHPQDIEFFLAMCRRRGMKPVNFIPTLDDDFEYYFKKDSLWQSEDLAAVCGQDVQRVCILQGPVAVKHSTVVDEPVKSILDDIHDLHIACLTRDRYNGDKTAIPVVEGLGRLPAGCEVLTQVPIEGLAVSYGDGSHEDICTYTLPESPSAVMPSIESWLGLLAGPEGNWRHALLSSEVVMHGKKFGANPLRRVFAPCHGLSVEIHHPKDPARTHIIVKERQQALGRPYKEVIEIMLAPKDEIRVSLIHHVAALGKPVRLSLRFTYHPEAGNVPIYEVMGDRNDRINEFYWRTWFGNEPLELDNEVDAVFDGGKSIISGKDIHNFMRAVGNTGEVFAENKVVYAPMDFAMVVGWQAVMKAVFAQTIGGDLSRLVHLSNEFRMWPGASPLRSGDEVSSSARVKAVIIQDSGKTVEVSGMIERAGEPVVEITSRFLYRGVYNDFENSFHRKDEAPMRLSIASSQDAAVLTSKKWFFYEAEYANADLVGQTLTFRLQSLLRFENKTLDGFSSVGTYGQVLLELPNKDVAQVGSVRYEAGRSEGNPVIDFLERHGSLLDECLYFEKPIPLTGRVPLQLRMPASNETYARVSRDHNPIHVSRVFSLYAELPGTITHGMYSSAAVRSLAEMWAADKSVHRFRSFRVSMVGMVLPNDEIEVELQHVGMVSGRKVIKVEARNKATGQTVLLGEAEVEQPVTAYTFTGQGAQHQGMGMEIYASSAAARDVWDRADRFLVDNYGKRGAAAEVKCMPGFSIVDIVRNNPRELTVYFGGQNGAKIRGNYMAMTFDTVDPDGNVRPLRIFKDVDEKTRSYTYRSPAGLLSATQFTQPALTIMEQASFQDMKAKGLVPDTYSFAGHSLGEFSALVAAANIMSIEKLVSVAFYRGLTMQVAVKRDIAGRSNYSMCAVNPSKFSSAVPDAALELVVSSITEETDDWLLEIVNHNIQDRQYVVAGDLRALDTLAGVTNHLKRQNIDVGEMQAEKARALLRGVVKGCADETLKKPTPLELDRGFATTPLRGIDVPFHSTFLRYGIESFRTFLLSKVDESTIAPSKLVGRYIPNMTARPLALTREYFEYVYSLTHSPRIAVVLESWPAGAAVPLMTPGNEQTRITSS
ncbi:beta subunit of fatty acid synthetase [Neonectria magnoliae]|uniref:Beta subunit of fatty acid synthetase n=1 Tax=Neonectria magnoliae TaxID=2732573 RepID=A0ABR1HPD8_9HYPO